MLDKLQQIEAIIHRFSKRFPASEEGQSIVVVALFFFFVFLAFAAVGIDGTIVYLRRRQLQNIADATALAAAVELAQTRPITAAYQVAIDTIETNGGQAEWFSTSSSPDPPNTNVGSGLDLTTGIEISGSCDVRVALRWNDIGTYFAQFVGRELLQVGATAHAGCNRAGGLQPIAMKRFGDEFDTDDGPPPPNPSNPSTIYCETCDTRRSLAAAPPDEQGNASAYDFFRPKASDQDEIAEWPGWPNGLGLYQSPSPHTVTGNPGREFFFLGEEAGPNLGNNSFSGLVNLDIRRPVGSPTVKYYNGVAAGTQPNVMKDLGEYYIQRGYCCDIPVPGDWVAMFSGTSSAFSPQALQDTYPPGDVIAILIYNGTVLKTPSMAITGEIPNQKATYPTTTTISSEVLTYSLTLAAIDDFQTSPMGLTMDVEGLEGFADWSFSNSSPPLGHSGIYTRNITLTVVPTVTTVGTTTHVVTGTRMFYVSAVDDKFSGSGVTRYWAGVASIGDHVPDEFGVLYQRQLPAVTGIPNSTADNYPYLLVAKGDQATYAVDLNLWEGASDQDVTVDFTGTLPTGFSWVGSPPWTQNNVRANPPPQSKVNIKIKVDSSATATAVVPHELPFLVTAADGMTQTFKLYVFVEEAPSTANDFVEILGYAAVEILGYYNNKNLIDPYNSHPANTVRGRFVSKIMQDPSELMYGLRARLIPWEQP
jgi:hypothetical protein